MSIIMATKMIALLTALFQGTEVEEIEVKIRVVSASQEARVPLWMEEGTVWLCLTQQR